MIPEGDIQENSKITEENSIQEDEEEIQIKSEDFHRIFNGIIKKLADFLKSNRTNIRAFFKNIIYTHEVSETEYFEAIKLQFFIKDLKKIDIQVDTIAMYCLFEKLKFSEEIESIDVKKLTDEMKIHGIIENNIKIEDNSKNEEFFYKIGKFLKEKNLKLSDFLQSKLINIDIEYEKKECIRVLDLTKILNEIGINTQIDIIKNITNLFLTDDKEYVIFDKFKSSLEYYFKRALKNKEINSDEIDQNKNSKAFNDSQKSDQQFDDEKKKLMMNEKQNEMKKYEEDMDFIQELSHEDSSRSKIIVKI